MRSHWTPARAQAVAILAVAGLALVGVMRVPVFADEADNVLGACLMARGAVIYRDFFSHHFPLPYYVLSLLGEAGGCSVLAARLLGGALLIAAGAGAAWVTRSRSVAPALLVMALAAPAYYLQMFLAETFVAAGLILSLSLLAGPGRRRAGPIVHAIRFAALVLLIWASPIGLMMAVPIVGLQVAGASGRRAAVGGTCLAALLFLPAVMAIQGNAGPFAEQAIAFNMQVYSQYLGTDLSSPPALLWGTITFARHRFSFVVDGLIGQEMKATTATYSALLELGLLAMLTAALVRARGNRLLRLATVLVLPLAVARDGFHLAPFVPMATIAGAHLLPAALGSSSMIRVGASLVAILALRLYCFYLPLEWGAADALAESLQPDARIAELSRPGDAVLYLPLAPHGYLAQDRRPGSFYTFFLPWQADIPGAEDRVIADIDANRVAVIYMDQDTLVWDRYRLREYAPRLHQHVLSHFQPVDHRDARRARIFVRAQPSP